MDKTFTLIEEIEQIRSICLDSRNMGIVHQDLGKIAERLGQTPTEPKDLPSLSEYAAREAKPITSSTATLDQTQWDELLRGPRMSNATGRVIFKYQLPVLEAFEMQLPAGAEIIRMTDQEGLFWMWAVVDTDAPLETRKFRAFKTGAAIPAGLNLQYLGYCAIFVQMELGLYIFEEHP